MLTVGCGDIEITQGPKLREQSPSWRQLVAGTAGTRQLWWVPCQKLSSVVQKGCTHKSLARTSYVVQKVQCA